MATEKDTMNLEKNRAIGKKTMDAQTDETRKKQAAFWLEYGHQLNTTIRYTEALRAFERSLALDDTNAEVWYAKGTCLAMLAQNEQALEAFEHALILNAVYVPAWDGMAWVQGILGHKAEALTAVNRALELDPAYFEAAKRKKRLEAME